MFQRNVRDIVLKMEAVNFTEISVSIHHVTPHIIEHIDIDVSGFSA
jgi:hypothetical protein